MSGLVLALAMGIGRFVYTPILPMMLEEIPLRPEDGAVAASANYVGYLLGVLTTVAVHPWAVRKPTVVFFAALLAVSLGVTGLSSDLTWIMLMRFLAGVASAFLFVGSVEAGWRSSVGHPHRAQWIYAGVGFGIVLSVIAPVAGTWDRAWVLSGFLGLLTVPCAMLLSLPSKAEQAESKRERLAAQAAQPEKKRRTSVFGWLLGSYTLEGAAYIVGTTFLVAALQSVGPVWANSAWVILGLAIMPSMWLWAALTKRSGQPAKILVIALTIQTVGMIALGLPGAFLGVAGALILGGTFMGATAISLKLGLELAGSRGPAIATAGYGIGQVLGPIIVTPVLGDSYQTAMLVGAGLAFLAALAAFRVYRALRPA